MENTECLIIREHAPIINRSNGRVARSMCIITLRFQLLHTFLVKFQGVRKAPASSALTKSCTEAVACASQIVTYVEHKGERK